MAKNDYDVIVYKILLYLYAVLKREIVFRKDTFDELISKADISNEYLADILRMMQDEGLIEGALIIRAWGGDSIIAGDMTRIRITAAGIRYLKDNSKMQKIREALVEIPGLAATLINIVKPL